MTRLKTLNQLLTDNPNLLIFVTVPQSAQDDLDAATLKTAIIRRCGDVEPYYQKPADFSLFGTLWFNTHDFLFAHALEIWKATYNPIENYDRNETETVSGTRESSGGNIDRHSGQDSTSTDDTLQVMETHSGTDTASITDARDIEETHSGTDATTKSGSKSGSDIHSGTDTLTDNVTRETEIAGFNSANYSDANRETETGTHATLHGESIAHTEQSSDSESISHGHTVTTDEDATRSESTTHGHRIGTDTSDLLMSTVDYGHVISNSSEATEEHETSRSSRIHGNIGVTTSQQMLESEMELASKFWIYDYIASAFETDNFITTYNSYYDNI